MGKVIQPPIERHIITKDGQLDVTITLNLNITLDGNGGLNISLDNVRKKESRDTPLLVPEFEKTTEIIEFGNKVD